MDDLYNKDKAASLELFGAAQKIDMRSWEMNYMEMGKQKLVVFVETSPDNENCHACKAALGIAIYEQVSTGWKPELLAPVVGRYGSWGKLSSSGGELFSVVTVAPDKTGFVLFIEDMAQGAVTTIAHIFVPVKGAIKDAAEIPIRADATGDCGDLVPPKMPRCRTTISKWRFLPEKTYGFYGIEISNFELEITEKVRETPLAVKKLFFDGQRYESARLSR